MVVRYYLPLQQGLRLADILDILITNSSQILSSITTRIKTIKGVNYDRAMNVSDTIFHYNKD